jgi:hypothetical protein
MRTRLTKIDRLRSKRIVTDAESKTGEFHFCPTTTSDSLDSRSMYHLTLKRTIWFAQEVTARWVSTAQEVSRWAHW